MRTICVFTAFRLVSERFSRVLSSLYSSPYTIPNYIWATCGWPACLQKDHLGRTGTVRDIFPGDNESPGRGATLMMPTPEVSDWSGIHTQPGLPNPWGVPHHSEITGFMLSFREGDWESQIALNQIT